MSSFNIKQVLHHLAHAYGTKDQSKIQRWEAEAIALNPTIKGQAHMWKSLWQGHPPVGAALVTNGWKADLNELSTRIFSLYPSSAELSHPNNLQAYKTILQKTPGKILNRNDVLSVITKHPEETVELWKIFVEKIDLLTPLNKRRGERFIDVLASTLTLAPHFKIAKDHLLDKLPLQKYEDLIISLKDVKAIKESPISVLRTTNAGWYHPSSETVVAGSSYHHNEVVLEHPVIPQPLKEWASTAKPKLAAWLEDETVAFYDNVPEGDHPEGHCIDIWRSTQDMYFDSLTKAYLFDEGWVKILIMPEAGSLAIEGNQSTIARHKGRIEKCVDALNLGKPYPLASKIIGQTKTSQQFYNSCTAEFRSIVAPYSPTIER